MRGREKRAAEIARRLDLFYPDARCELDFDSPWQLLAATVLSAQCTDVRVNRVTPELFRRWPTPEAMTQADIAEIEEVIHSTGFFRNKARALRDGARVLVADHDGELPRTLEGMVALPGVGRKTAKVVLGEAFNIPAGIAVDTHVKRLARRFGLSDETDPDRIAGDLEGLLPDDKWVGFSLRVVLHGRRVCPARKPQCDDCVIEGVCLQRL
ncbi:MAG: endonuclease III [Acidobacteria bacterium]|nr:endonuclease III [Acidobacteriota bacterium]